MQYCGCQHAAGLFRSEAVNAVLWLSTRDQPLQIRGYECSTVVVNTRPAYRTASSPTLSSACARRCHYQGPATITGCNFPCVHLHLAYLVTLQ